MVPLPMTPLAGLEMVRMRAGGEAMLR